MLRSTQKHRNYRKHNHRHLSLIPVSPPFCTSRYQTSTTTLRTRPRRAGKPFVLCSTSGSNVSKPSSSSFSVQEDSASSWNGAEPSTAVTPTIQDDAKELIRLSIPCYLAQITEPLAALADLYFIGQVGPLPIAGVAVAAAIYNTFCYTFTSLSYTANAHVAAQINKRDAANAATSAALIAIYIGLVVGFAMYVLAPILIAAMGAAASTVEYALIYLRTRAIGIVPTFLGFSLCGVFRARHDLVTPFVSSCIGASLNLILDAIVVPRAGVMGVGIVTSVSVTAASIYLAMKLFAIRAIRWPKSLFVRMKDLRPLMAPLIPLSTKRVLESTTLAFCCSTAARNSPYAAAAMEIAQQTWWTVGISYWPIGLACSVIIAGIVAREKDSSSAARKRAANIGLLAILAVALVGCVGGAGIWMFSHVIPTFFVREVEYVSVATQAVKYLAILLPFSAIVDCTDAVLVAMGDSFFVFAAAGMGVALCFAILAASGWSGSVATVFVALGAMCVVQVILVLIRFAVLFYREQTRSHGRTHEAISGTSE